MSLDIRIPIGLMFGIFGVILVIFGLCSDAEIYTRSLNHNVNLIWGIALLVFSGGMLGLAWRARQKGPKSDGPDQPS